MKDFPVPGFPCTFTKALKGGWGIEEPWSLASQYSIHIFIT
jgi:hypothetical protein